jgi:hypothetical protein
MEQTNESPIISKEVVRQLQDHSSQRGRSRHLQEPQAQAAARITEPNSKCEIRISPPTADAPPRPEGFLWKGVLHEVILRIGLAQKFETSSKHETSENGRTIRRNLGFEF